MAKIQGLTLDGDEAKRTCVMIVADYSTTGLHKALEPGEDSAARGGLHGEAVAAAAAGAERERMCGSWSGPISAEPGEDSAARGELRGGAVHRQVRPRLCLSSMLDN